MTEQGGLLGEPCLDEFEVSQVNQSVKHELLEPHVGLLLVALKDWLSGASFEALDGHDIVDVNLNSASASEWTLSIGKAAT